MPGATQTICHPLKTTQTPFRWMRIPWVGCAVVVEPDGRQILLEEEIGTAEAARIIGCRQRTVQRLCDEGVLVEGRDWRKVPGCHGIGGKLYRIKRRAAMAFRKPLGD